jgi:hypothetical protein
MKLAFIWCCEAMKLLRGHNGRDVIGHNWPHLSRTRLMYAVLYRAARLKSREPRDSHPFVVPGEFVTLFQVRLEEAQKGMTAARQAADRNIIKDVPYKCSLLRVVIIVLPSKPNTPEFKRNNACLSCHRSSETELREWVESYFCDRRRTLDRAGARHRSANLTFVIHDFAQTVTHICADSQIRLADRCRG